jgi:hypothetical protein
MSRCLLVVAICACSHPPRVTSVRAVPPDLTATVRAGRTFVLPYWRVPEGFARGATAPVARVECTVDQRGAEIESVRCANIAMRAGELAWYPRLTACAKPREAVAPTSALRDFEAAIRAGSGPTQSPPGLVVLLHYRTRTHVALQSGLADVQIATDRVPVPPDTVEERLSGMTLLASRFVVDGDAGKLLLGEMGPERHSAPSATSRMYWFDPRFTLERVIEDHAFFSELARAMEAIDPRDEGLEARLAYHANRLLLAAHAGDRAAVLAAGARLDAEREKLQHEPWTLDLDRELSWLRELAHQLERFAADDYSLRDPCR